jgi:hypothetical protein
MKNAQVRKTIYSLPDLQDLMRAANRRYLEFLSALEDPTDGIKNLEKLSRNAHDGHRTHRGFNLFDLPSWCSTLRWCLKVVTSLLVFSMRSTRPNLSYILIELRPR